MMISVVLNVLNEKRHMRDLLDSLVIQEKPWEIVVVDAGSNDGTVEIVQNYMKKFPEIKFFHCPGTRGESTNFGIQQAQGNAVATTGGELELTFSRPYRSCSTSVTSPRLPKPAQGFPSRASSATRRRSTVTV